MVNKKPKSREYETDHTQGLVLGTVAAGLIGIGAALFLSSKKGQQLCEEISDRACDLSDSLKEQGEEMFDKVHCWIAPEKKTNTNLIIGGIAGGLLGAAGIYWALQYTDAGQDLVGKAQQLFPNDFKKKSAYWIHKTRDTLERLTDTISQLEEDFIESSKSSESKLHSFAELANLGLRLFNGIQQRR